MADPYAFWPYMPPGGPVPMAQPPMNVHPGMAPGPVRPLSPSDFHGPGVQQHQAPPVPRQWSGPGGEAPSFLSPHETAVMRGMLDVLRQGREAMAAGRLDGMELQRLTAAHAYLSGFFEARGMGELGAFLRTIPPPSPGSVGPGDGRYNAGPGDFPFGP